MLLPEGSEVFMAFESGTEVLDVSFCETDLWRTKYAWYVQMKYILLFNFYQSSITLSCYVEKRFKSTKFKSK